MNEMARPERTAGVEPAPAPAGDLKSSTRRGIRWSGIAAIATAAVQFLRVFLLARFLLEPDDFGLMSLALAVTYVASPFADMGTLVALVHRQDATRREISSLYWFNAAFGIVFFLGVWLCAPFVAHAFAEPRLVGVLRASAVCFAIDGFGIPFLFLLKRDLEFRIATLIETRALLAGTIVTLGLAVWGAGVWSLVAGVIALSLVRTLQAVLHGAAKYPIELRMRAGELKEFFRFGAFQTAQTLIVRVSERFDQMILGQHVGAAGLGLYSVAYNLASMPVVHVMPLLSWPAAAALARSQHDDERLARGYLLAVETMMVVNASISFGLLAIAPRMVPLVLGPKWAGIVPIFQCLCVVTIWHALYSLSSTLVVAKGAVQLGFAWRLGLTSVLIVAAYLGAKWGGAVGLAAVLAAVLTLALLPFYFAMVRRLLGPCARQFAVAVGAPLFMAVTMAAVVMLIGDLMASLPSIVVLAIQMLAGALVFAAMLVFIRPATAREMILIVPHARLAAKLLELLALVERVRGRILRLPPAA